MFKYVGKTLMADISFGIFFVSWLVARTWLFSLVVKSVIYDCPRLIPLVEKGVVGVSFSWTAHRVFVVLLSTLVVLLAIWLAMIARVLIRVLRGGSAEDVRSDDEE